jgi:hypothetical protein
MKIGNIEFNRATKATKLADPGVEAIISAGGYKIVEIAPSTAIGPAIFVADNNESSPVSLSEARNNAIKQLSLASLQQNNTSAPFGELGSTGSSIWYNLLREEYNPELRGQQGFRKFDQMRRSDAMVRSSLRIMKTPVLAARWFIEPASMSKKDQKIAEYVEDNLMKWMTISFTQVLIEALLCLDFGYFMFEKVFDYHPDGSGRIIWRKLAPRHPIDVIKWEYDEHGGPKRAWFYDPSNAEGIPIPIEKLLVFTFDREAGNLEGISILRSAYKHWYFKENLYKIDAIQKERHGIGIPIIKLPPGFSSLDKSIANDLGANLRTNERAHVVLPPMWEIEFAELRGQPTNAIESIRHHNEQISVNVLAAFINNISGSSAETTQEMFYKATRFVAENIRDIFNKHAIPELVRYNWPNVTEFPELKVRRIGDTTDWRSLSFALRNLIGAGLITSDDKIEKYLREEMDLPQFDPESAREQETPQAPQGAKAGMPRQVPATKGFATKPLGGTDRSGK